MVFSTNVHINLGAPSCIFLEHPPPPPFGSLGLAETSCCGSCLAEEHCNEKSGPWVHFRCSVMNKHGYIQYVRIYIYK